MKIAGIIAEYNPFHSGHAHHIRQTREMCGCDAVVVCMAGSFTQRGEAACLDKWSRAEAALRCGADAVFELPALWAVRSADAFARGGVAILSGLGCDVLSFGSERAELPLLKSLARLKDAEPEDLSAAIRAKLDEGKSHARARGEALAEWLRLPPDALNAPNLILGTEYLRAMDALAPSMQPLVVPRRDNYHDDALGELASASAIRAAIVRGELSAALTCVPEAARPLLAAAPKMHAPDDLLLHALRNMTEAELSRLCGAGEGLENRVANCAREAAGWNDLIERAKCKRYTRARIARLCASALLGMDAEFCARRSLPEYARLLGMRADAGALLRELKARATLPIRSQAAQLLEDEVFQLECRATDLRALLCDDPRLRRAGQDCAAKFVLV